MKRGIKSLSIAGLLLVLAIPATSFCQNPDTPINVYEVSLEQYVAGPGATMQNRMTRPGEYLQSLKTEAETLIQRVRNEALAYKHDQFTTFNRLSGAFTEFGDALHAFTIINGRSQAGAADLNTIPIAVADRHVAQLYWHFICSCQQMLRSGAFLFPPQLQDPEAIGGFSPVLSMNAATDCGPDASGLNLQ